MAPKNYQNQYGDIAVELGTSTNSNELPWKHWEDKNDTMNYFPLIVIGFGFIIYRKFFM